MITGKILVHGLALLLQASPSIYNCWCNSPDQNCSIWINYYRGNYYHTVYLDDRNYQPMIGEVEYRCARKKQ